LLERGTRKLAALKAEEAKRKEEENQLKAAKDRKKAEAALGEERYVLKRVISSLIVNWPLRYGNDGVFDVICID